ncbi:MAG: rhodanese-like domain-containing protein [Pseudomonadota bacterium]
MSKLKLLSLLFIIFPIYLQAANLRLTPEQLKQSLSNYIILDARSSLDYQAGHIKGAINFPIDLTYEQKNVNGKITRPMQMQTHFRERGIEQNSTIIIYDNGAMVDAARLFWTLEVYGIQHVKVLDHGYDHWLNKNYPISLEQEKRKTSLYVASINHKRLASKFTTQLATQNPNQFIIDARSSSDYQGKTSTAQRFGHIPTAVSYPASHNFNMSENILSLQPVDALKDIYSGVPKNKKIIIYCAIGRISSANYLALRELNYDVANYDASWKEWGNDLSLPIEN